MQDPFSEVVDDSAVRNDDDALMTRATDTPMSPPGNASVRPSGNGKTARQPIAPSEFATAAQSKLVCPFCGSINERSTNQAEPTCPRCAMQDTSATRQATKTRIGPWFVRQTRNPSAPGMRFETLLTLVARGQISAGSVVRGPTTHQLWRFAAQVKGLSREFGLCYSCGASIDRTASLCPACNRMQEPPVNPDVLLESPIAPAPVSGIGTPHASSPMSATPPVIKAPKPVSPHPNAPQPAEERPKPAAPDLSGRPKRNSSLRRGEEILTARELAAAFQLDFVPANERSKGSAWKNPRRAGRKIALVIVLLLGALAAGALIKRPDWRQSVSTFAVNTFTSVKSAIADATASTPDEPVPPVTQVHSSPETMEQPLPDAGLAIERPPVAPLSHRVVDPSADELRDVPSSSTVETARSDPREDAQPPVASVPSSTQTPRPTDQSSATTSAEDLRNTTVSASMSATDQLDKARTLYRQAIEAERQRPPEYSEAVRLYEQVKKMPREVWPGDLEIRLERARRSIK